MTTNPPTLILRGSVRDCRGRDILLSGRPRLPECRQYRFSVLAARIWDLRGQCRQLCPGVAEAPYHAGGDHAPYRSSPAGLLPANCHATDRALSERLIVMSEYSSRVLERYLAVSGEKIESDSAWHPRLHLWSRMFTRIHFHSGERLSCSRLACLSPNKGFESVIRALPRIRARHSNAVYVIAGATHPHVWAREGDRYREQLQALAKDLGVEERDLPQPLRQPRGDGGAGWLGRHLHHALLPRGTGCIGTLPMHWAPGRRSSPLRTGTRPNFLDDGRELWFPLRIRLPLQRQPLNFWTTMRSANPCVAALTFMRAGWSGTAQHSPTCIRSRWLRQSHAACSLEVSSSGCRDRRREPTVERLSALRCADGK